MKILTLSPQQKHWARIFASLLLLAVMSGTLLAGWKCFSWYEVAKSEYDLDRGFTYDGSAEIDRQRWQLKQARLYRGGWGTEHDDFAYFGRYGTKDEAVFMIRSLKRGLKALDSCLGGDGPIHLSAGLALMTNHDLGPTSDAWIDWLAENEGKTQREWILDGFRQAHLTLDYPPQREQVVEVFRRVGRQQEFLRWQEAGYKKKDLPRIGPLREGLPKPVTFNAFRLLRDARFKMETLQPEDLQGPEAVRILEGAAQFATFCASQDGRSELGHVFDSPVDSAFERDDSTHRIFRQLWLPWAWWGIVAAVEIPCLLGLRRLWRRRVSS